MLGTLVNIVYVLVAVAMVVLILLQRGAGASAGSGFGAGASATVFGARGSANFLSKSTAVLATLFFAFSLGMAIAASRGAREAAPRDDLGVMDSATVPSEIPPASSEVPTVDPAVPVEGAAAPVDDATEAPVETEAPAEEGQDG